MDTGEIHRVGSLHRDGSGSVWRRGDAAFSNSRSLSRGDDGEDDEEALRWAALEKLPTFARLQHAVLPPSDDPDGDGEGATRPRHHAAARVVDVRGLGPHERRALMERLVRVADEDNERFLRRLKDRIERVGLDLPTIEVRFEHLEAMAQVRVGSSGLPTLLNSVTNKLEDSWASWAGNPGLQARPGGKDGRAAALAECRPLIGLSLVLSQLGHVMAFFSSPHFMCLGPGGENGIMVEYFAESVGC
ncbi:hypothetical protein PR202_gb00206 [Eleusine coracana subsp. coracana]|uniref:Pleiotropic ABC efflux transporter N-terminal domain-containing protein n=1 Tax=Eleusine coracana subsp. coracana TaxID=191504 RepID=A0AAV5DTF8_ELECO|nr:hypothetical protein PR202_gb00206 [Eleusine coracana subsp. coracana]